MRKVKFKKWESAVGGFEKEFINDGIFHQWANNYTESEEGFGNYTVGLIELPDGTISEVLPTNIKFIE